jgi:hypothetical protein
MPFGAVHLSILILRPQAGGLEYTPAHETPLLLPSKHPVELSDSSLHSTGYRFVFSIGLQRGIIGEFTRHSFDFPLREAAFRPVLCTVFHTIPPFVTAPVANAIPSFLLLCNIQQATTLRDLQSSITIVMPYKTKVNKMNNALIVYGKDRKELAEGKRKPS